MKTIKVLLFIYAIYSICSLMYVSYLHIELSKQQKTILELDRDNVQLMEELEMKSCAYDETEETDETN